MHEMRRYFNLAEANETVPRLEFIFSELARIQREVNLIYSAAERSGVNISPERIVDWKSFEASGMPSLGDRIRALAEEYMSLVDEIARMGVVPDDIELGIVGFYSWFDGQEILLSWQYGEPEVGYWHSVGDRPDARRSIAELVPFDEIPANIH